MTEPATDRTDLVLRWVAAAATATGIAALLLDVYGVIGMPFTLTFVALPATLFVVALAALGGRAGRTDVARRIWVGFVAGAAATAVYDVSRLLIAAVVDLNPFRAHPNFGALMLDTSPDTTAAMIAGWGYHFWNGFTFAVMFTLLAGGARVRWAVLWALVLETATIAVTPQYLNIDSTDVFFVTVSLLGHLFYGLVLGWLSRQWLHPERTWPSPWTLDTPRWRSWRA